VLGLIETSDTYIISPFYSVSNNVKIGDLLVISDQFNFSGRSPLFGHNIDHWGDRFFDMAKVFKSIEDLPHSAKKVNLGMVVGPIYHSELEANYYSTSLVEVITTGVIFDTHVLRHSFTRSGFPRFISCFGYAVGSLLSQLDHFEVDHDSVLKFLDLIQFLAN